jgi:predicted DNA-binding transcriptional regulator AlpA
MKDVVEKVGLGRSRLYRMIVAGMLPKLHRAVIFIT